MKRTRLVVAALILNGMVGAIYGQAQYNQPPYNSNQDWNQAGAGSGYSDGQNAQGPQDEPGRPVARLSLMNGDVSVRRGDSGDWVAASVNAPLMVEDAISVAPGGYAEVQFDSANILRIAGDSEARISTLDAGRFGVQVLKGMITYRVLRQTTAQSEVATPQVAVRPGANSAVRVEMLADGYSRIEIRAGEAEVFTPKGVERVKAGSMMMVRGSASDPEFQLTQASALDEWDNFNIKRDRDLLATKSYQYMSRDIYGGEDLDRNGQWVNDPQYGNVWAPAVSADWAPYRDGRWVWEDYYGWTWVGAEPWGWAPYHYGSWYYRGGGFGWCWFPGRPYAHYYYRPALVAFFGFGGGFGIGIGGGIGWVPLAPYERFRPWYGRGWYGGRNVVNNVTIVNNTNITNIYRNARVTNGVSGLNSQAFSSGQFHNIRPIGPQNLQSASLVHGALPVQPTQAHLGFSGRPASPATPRISPAVGARFAPSHLQASNAGSARTSFSQQQSSFANLGQSRGPAQSFTRGGTQGSVSRGVIGAAGSSAVGQGWQRFGSPQSNGAQANSFRSGNAPSQNWNSFGRPAGPSNSAPQPSSPRYAAPQQQYSRPQQEAPRSAYQAPAQRYQPQASQQSGRPIQVAPPMVQQRSAAPQQRSQPSVSRPSGGGGGGGSRPSGGGGGHASSGGHSHR